MFGTGVFSASFAVLLLVGCCSSARAQEVKVASPVQTLLKEGDSAFANGDYETARRSFEKALQVTQQSPPASPVRYEVLKRLTSTIAASGQFADAQRYLQQALEWRESTIGANDPKIEDDLKLSVTLHMRTKEFDRALATAQRIQAMHVKTYTSESTQAADDLLRIGQIYLAQKQPREAVRSLAEAAQVRTKLLGSFDPGLLPVLDRLNEAFVAIGGLGGNESVLRQALVIRETLYGENSAEIISTLEGLADACSAGGEYVSADLLYSRLLSLWENLVGKDHPMVAIVLDKLVVFYTKEGLPEKAREALARSVAIRARFLAVGLSHQATDEIAAKHPDRAKALYNRALAALGPPGPPNEELIAQIKKALGNIQAPPAK
jgi:tetratricopeptide (TPR) repeat protein